MDHISEQFELNLREWWKGAKLGLFGAVSGYITNIMAAPGFDLLHGFKDWHTILNGALVAGGLYLLTTFAQKPPKTE